MKSNLMKLAIVLTLLLLFLTPMIVEATGIYKMQANIQNQLTDDLIVPTDAMLNVGDDNANGVEDQEHLPIEDLYEQLQEYGRVYDEDGGFYELVPISEIISEEDLERVVDELNDESYSIVADFALFNIDGEPLPMPRTHVVRHQRFLGTTSNSRYFFRHVPGFHYGGSVPPSNSGNGWRFQTWQINIGGSWIRAFCTQPGVHSAFPSNDDLSGWNPSTSGELTQIQRETIGRILQHGYRNIHRPPSSNSENWSFPSSSGSDDLLDDAIMVTQILIQEVTAGQWDINNITLGSRSPINTSGVHGDPWRRLIANSATSNGMVGGPSGNVTQGVGGESFNPRPAVGSTRRMDMYDAIRHDVYFFGRRNNRPRGTSASSTTANRPVHTLTWSNTHQMYRIEIDDRTSSGGTGTLRRFFGTRTQGSLGIGGGYRFCRGTQTAGVCNPSATSNRLIIYTTDSSATPANSTDTMRWNPTATRDRAVGFFVNPIYQNKVVGANLGVYYAHFRVQITPRSRPPVEVIKYSNATNQRLADTTIELCRGSNTNVAGQTAETNILSATDWCWEVTTNDQGVANFPVDESIVSVGGNPFAGMLSGRRYRVREISAPASYTLPPLDERTVWIEVGTGGATEMRSATFRNDLAFGRLRVDHKFGNHIVGFEPYGADGENEEIVEDDRVVTVLSDFRDLFRTADREESLNPNPPYLYRPLEQTPRQGIRWIFDDLPIESVRIHVYAREDIVLNNGSVIHEAGDFVAYYDTNENGFIETGDLHLGRYFAREVSAPNGWYIHDIEIDFELTYEDQYTAIVFADIEIENQWQQVEINLWKTGETFDDALGFTEVFIPLEGVQFGLLAGENFEMPNGQILYEDTLIKDGFTDVNGELQFLMELPLGRFCIQELAVAEFYVVDDTLHCFVHTGEQQDQPIVEIVVDELDGLKNYFVRGSFEIIKTSAEEREEVEADEPEEDSVYEDDENEPESEDSEQPETLISDEEVVSGDEIAEDDEDDADDEQWLLPDVEFRLYLLNPLYEEAGTEDPNDKTDDTGEYEEVAQIDEINDDNTNNDVTENDEYNKMPDSDDKNASTPENDLTTATYVSTFVTDENGRIFVDDLIFGDYVLVESVAHYRHQLLLEPIFFSISYDHQHHEFEVINYQTRTEITKLDDLLEPLAGARFHILDYETEEVVMEFTSTLETEIIFGLAHGTYILREIEAPYSFALSEDITFTVTDLEETVSVVVVNELDSSVEIATQAHTGDGVTQYFSHGEIIEMFDNIDITHMHIREGTPRAFKVYLFAVVPNGNPANDSDRTLIWESDYREYTVENVGMTFRESTNIDTSQFEHGTTFFFAETAYREILDDEGDRIGWEEDYRHNWDGSDQNQMLFPRDVRVPQPQSPRSPQAPQTPQLRLPQTGITNRVILLVVLGGMVTVTTCVIVKARKSSKVSRIIMSSTDKLNR